MMERDRWCEGGGLHVQMSDGCKEMTVPGRWLDNGKAAETNRKEIGPDVWDARSHVLKPEDPWSLNR